MLEDRQSGYTIVEHEMFSSIPARLLSAGGRAALLDFRRLWMRESHNDTLYVRAVIWTWAGCCDWCVSRKTYGRYQREVVEKGFADVVSLHSGHYRASERWRSYSPVEVSEGELAWLEQHEAARSSRCESTRRYRESRKALTTRGQNGPLSRESRGPETTLTTRAEVGPKWPNPQGVKIAQPVGSQNGPDPNTPILTIQPPPTPSQDSTASDSGDVGCTAHFETIDGEHTQTWPPPASARRTSSALEAWGAKVFEAGFMSDAHYDETMQKSKLLKVRDEKRAAERERRKSDPAYDFMRVSEDMQSGKLAMAIADALSEPQARRRIEKRISGKEKAAREIVAGILQRPGMIRSPVAVLMARLKELEDEAPDVGR